jgi:hypothetical protein
MSALSANLCSSESRHESGIISTYLIHNHGNTVPVLGCKNIPLGEKSRLCRAANNRILCSDANCSNVDLPAPRNPVMIVTGTFRNVSALGISFIIAVSIRSLEVP